MKLKEKCSVCKEEMQNRYLPMKQWKIEGPLCGKCYSKKISDFYPGEHVRIDGSKKKETD